MDGIHGCWARLAGQDPAGYDVAGNQLTSAQAKCAGGRCGRLGHASLLGIPFTTPDCELIHLHRISGVL